jgi:hypothetical protein
MELMANDKSSILTIPQLHLTRGESTLFPYLGKGTYS